MRSLSEVIDGHAERRPNDLAFVDGDEQLDWRGYAARSRRLAAQLVGLGLEPGERVAVWLPDGPGVHVAYLAAERAGLVTVGIGPRAGEAELRHLLAKTGAAALLSRARHGGLEVAPWVSGLRREGLPLRHHVVVTDELSEAAPVRADGVALPEPGPEERRPLGHRRMAPDDLFLLNSTSGTTGLPKCVRHDQARWLAFHELAVDAGELSGKDVFASALPAPFGFGLWTAHFTPTLLGAPTVLFSSFDADELVRRIERHRVSVLAAVSTQFIMMLESPELDRRDLSSLRVLFTGGEAVPAERAAAFEERTGAVVLQFYGSNETGALSRTTTRDDRALRLGSAGRVIPSMQVRLFDDAGADVTASGRGQPGCRGPLASRGYWEDPEADAKLFTPDGWLLTGDVVTLDADGVLTVVGRVADFIIRGGKNVSGAAVEEACAGHPAVALCAAVAMPDPVFGERVCLYAELRPGAALTLDELVSHLRAAGASKELLPERLEVVDALPRASGGKIAKGELRADVRRRLAREAS
jgi:acyl-CoA synthetase